MLAEQGLVEGQRGQSTCYQQRLGSDWGSGWPGTHPDLPPPSGLHQGPLIPGSSSAVHQEGHLGRGCRRAPAAQGPPPGPSW